MKRPTVYTWGYSRRTFADFATILTDYDIGHVIDVRARPDSRRRPDFSRKRLSEALGPCYIWAPCLGNPWKHLPSTWIPPIGYRAKCLREVIHARMLGNILLLCLEQDFSKCHRSAAAEFIGLPIVHLGWPPEVPE